MRKEILGGNSAILLVSLLYALCIHLLQVVSNLEGCSSLSFDFFQRDTGCEFSESQSTLFSVNIKDTLSSTSDLNQFQRTNTLIERERVLQDQ